MFTINKYYCTSRSHKLCCGRKRLQHNGNKNATFLLILFLLTLIVKLFRLDPGFYKILLNVGPHSVTFNTKVVGRVQIESCEVGLSDADGSSAPRLEKINYGHSLSSRLNGDSGQKLIIKFTLTRQVRVDMLRIHFKVAAFLASRNSASFLVCRNSII